MPVAILDLGDFRGNTRDQFVADLRAAFRSTGFVALKGHSVTPSQIAAAYRVSRDFFALPEAVKLRYYVEGGGGARGYTPFGVENAKDRDVADLKEFWHVGRELRSGPAAAYPANIWPPEVPQFREVLLSLYDALDALGARVLQAIALGLDLPRDFFADKVQHGNSVLRPLHYPPVVTHVGSAVRSAPHEDINLITLLVGSEEPGLQIKVPGEGWVEAPSGDELIICNVGDMMQRLTNHVLPSTTHQVVNPPAPGNGRARYSIPFFLHPNGDFSIQTLPSCVDADTPDRYPEPILADDYLSERLREIGLL